MKTDLSFAPVRTCAVLSMAAFLVVVSPARAAAQEQQPRAVDFKNSCASEVQEELQSAIAGLHSFETAAAKFSAVARKDKGCMIAWWGAAMSARGNPLGGDFDRDALKAGRGFLAHAKALKATPRERAYVDALRIYYRDYPDGQPARTKAYEVAMENLAKAYPDDVEARTFYALSILEAVDLFDKSYARQLKAGAILEDVWRTHPDHPGAPHYLIHAYDYTPLAARGLPAARRYAAIAPASAHARHMPSHIFTILGLWRESIEANRNAALIVDPAGGSSPVGGDIASMHGFDFIAYARLQLAEDQQVAADLKTLRDRDKPFTLVEARYVLERAQWNEAEGLAVATDDGLSAAHTRFVRALGFARLKKLGEARTERLALAALRSGIEKDDGDYWASLVDIYLGAADAFIAQAEGRAEEARSLMVRTADQDDAREKHIYLENKLVPMRELLGELLLVQDRPTEAVAAFEQSLKSSPNRFRSFYGAARAARAAGDPQKAREYYGKLRDLAGASGESRPEIKEAEAFLAS